jgi:hypothetical protein
LTNQVLSLYFLNLFYPSHNIYIYEKLKKKKKDVEKLIESKKGSLNKFVINNKQNINANLVEKTINEQEIHEQELEDNEIIQQKETMKIIILTINYVI